MKSPNPIDTTQYKLIDTFNRAGNINANPTPTLGADWGPKLSPVILTNASGYLDFSSSSLGDYATYPLPTVGNTVSFDLTFGGSNKAMFLELRSSGGDHTTATGTALSVRIKDNGTNFLYRVREMTDGTSNELVAETDIPGASLVGTTKFPVVITDDGETVTLKIADGDAITISSTFGASNLFVQFMGALNTGNKVSNLRIY